MIPYFRSKKRRAQRAVLVEGTLERSFSHRHNIHRRDVEVWQRGDLGVARIHRSEVEIFLLEVLIADFNEAAKAQETNVEKSTFGVQTGVLGIWAYNEAKLSNAIALRT